MSDQTLTRGLQKKVDNTPIENGKIRVGIDEHRMFIDTSLERIEITDFVKGLTYSEIIHLQKPLPKVYLSSDTHQFLIYDKFKEDWVIYGGSGGSSDPSLYINSIDFDENGNIEYAFGDGRTVVIQNPLASKVSELESRLNELLEVIEINPVTPPENN